MRDIKRFLKIEDYVLFQKGLYTKERVMVGYGYPYQYDPNVILLAEVTKFIQAETGAEKDDIRFVHTGRNQSARYAGSVLAWVSVKADTVRQNFDDYKNLYC